MYSGTAMYILRSPTSRGSPALGWAEIGTVTTRASFSTASSIAVRAHRAVDPDHVGTHRGSSGPNTTGSVP